MAKLRPAWGGHQSSNHYLCSEGITVTPGELWTNIGGIQGVLTLFKNAGVMLEMAEFADRNCETIDHILLDRLRSDALQIRKRALRILVQEVIDAGTETVKINAFQLASMYTGMTARMVELVQQNAGEVLPDFVTAM